VGGDWGVVGNSRKEEEKKGLHKHEGSPTNSWGKRQLLQGRMVSRRKRKDGLRKAKRGRSMSRGGEQEHLPIIRVNDESAGGGTEIQKMTQNYLKEKRIALSAGTKKERGGRADSLLSKSQT